MAFEEIQKTYTEAYGNLITLLAQQTQSKLESCVTVQSGIKGKTAVAADQIGKFLFTDVDSRLADTELQDINRDRRWYEPVMKRGCVPLDNIDVIKTSLDPKSQIVVAGMAGVNRAKDAQIISGYYGVNKTGEHAETSTSFAAGNVIANTYGSGDIIKLNSIFSVFAGFVITIISSYDSGIFCTVHASHTCYYDLGFRV